MYRLYILYDIPLSLPKHTLGIYLLMYEIHVYTYTTPYDPRDIHHQYISSSILPILLDYVRGPNRIDTGVATSLTNEYAYEHRYLGATL